MSLVAQECVMYTCNTKMLVRKNEKESKSENRDDKQVIISLQKVSLFIMNPGVRKYSNKRSNTFEHYFILFKSFD